MKLAVIDCGTNTFNLLIIEVLKDQKSYERVHSSRVPVRLGEDSINEGFISEVPFMRGIDAISAFKHQLKKMGVYKVLAFATSAIRDASNGEKFVSEVRDLFDIEINVIDGDREAELIYLAIQEAVELSSNVSLIMDIGGGSTEFILANDQEIFWKQSFRIGAARLLEKFPHNNPISQQEIKNIKSYLREQLQPLATAADKYPPHELIGSSGAFESFIEMIHGEFGGEPFVAEKSEYSLHLNDYRKVSDLVLASSLQQRRAIKGLVPMRFDMIVICCLMVDFILEEFKLNKMRVSAFSLKEGALIEHLHTNKS
jgi:exopolyphosphatase/guanosine-5'-triphosphate,3'-diphosphate pyrophosphatase